MVKGLDGASMGPRLERPGGPASGAPSCPSWAYSRGGAGRIGAVPPGGLPEPGGCRCGSGIGPGTGGVVDLVESAARGAAPGAAPVGFLSS